MAINFHKNPIKKGNGLREVLHRQLANDAEPGRPLERIHASDITYQDRPFCPRERAILIRDKKKPPTQRLSTSENITYGIGHWLEDKLIETFADAGMAIGDWKCNHCGTVYKFCKRPWKCGTKTGGNVCGHKHFSYVELRITSPMTGISCGIDLVLEMPGQAKHKMVEIKSMDKDVFKTLQAPLAEHGVRTKLYMRSAAELADCTDNAFNFVKMLDTESAFILYTTKGGYGTACDEVANWNFWDSAYSPFKDYLVQRDDKSLEPYIAKAVEYKVWYDNFKAGTALPIPGRICTSSIDKRSKQCSSQTPCWTQKPGV